MRLVEVFGYPIELFITKATPISALLADVVRVLSRALVRADNSVVAVDACGNAGPDAA